MDHSPAGHDSRRRALVTTADAVHKFDGTLVTVPFSGTVSNVARDTYRDLLDSHAATDVLVVCGTPTSADRFRDVLAAELEGAQVPEVTSLIVHATDVLNDTGDRTIVSDLFRRELVHRFLADHDWDAPYLTAAAEHPSFAGDVGDLMAALAWQDSHPSTPPELREIGDALQGFHDWLDAHDHLERGQLITEATRLVDDAVTRASVLDHDVMLCVEFEELTAPDRRYLQALASDCELVCIAETDASVRRNWHEPGPITDQTSFTDTSTAAAPNPETRPAAVAQYLATGSDTTGPEEGSVSVIDAASQADQLTRVIDEIERLTRGDDWAYADIAVATTPGGTAAIETIEALEGAGIPTESTTITGFGDDPSVRRLLQVIRQLAAEPNKSRRAPDPAVLDDATRESLAEMDGLEAPLRRWATNAGFKDDLASSTPPLEARARFGNVNRVFRMAAFLEDTAFIDATWPNLQSMIERAHEYASQRDQTSAIDRAGGVRVDQFQTLKNESYRAVFLVDLVDETIPGDPFLTPLFPTDRAAAMSEFPAVTDLDPSDVTRTFVTSSTASERPLVRYHTEQARRRLAVAAAAASDRLYLCLYAFEDTALEEQVQPSRFLADLAHRFPWITTTESDSIVSERAAEEYVHRRIDDALTEVRRAHSQDVTVSLDTMEREFAEIDHLLAASGDRGDRLRDALRARLAFAAGEVRRD